MPRAVPVWILVLSSVTTVAFGACLETVLQSVNAQARKGFLTSADKETISGIWKRADLSNQDKAKLSYDVVLEARLRKLSPSEAAAIRRLAGRRSRTGSDVLDARYDPTQRQLTVELPEEFYGTVIEYFQMNHEVAHAIQDLLIARDTRVDTDLLFKETRNTDSYLRHLMEKGAVTEEYGHLTSIPKQERLRLIEAVGQSSALDAGSKRFLITALKNSFLDLDTYVSRELANRHYSLSFATRLSAEIVPAIQANGAYNWVILNPRKTILGTVSLVTSTSLLFVCEALHKSTQPDAQSLKKLCP